LFIDNNTHTHRYIVVYGTKAKALTGVSDAKKYKRKYKFQIANLKTVNMIIPVGVCAAKNDLKDLNVLK